jgi:hypothetical protein
MAAPPPLSIIIWKTKHNRKNEITQSRFFVKFGDQYLDLDARHYDSSDVSRILFDIEIHYILNIYTQTDIDTHTHSIKGRHNIMLHDMHRTTQDNIMMYRVYNDIQNAILNRINGFEGNTSDELYKRHSTYLINAIPHTISGRYGPSSDTSTDTDTILDGSMCSGDTRADIFAEANNDVNDFLGLTQYLNSAGDVDVDEINDIIGNHEQFMYEDTVEFRKALKHHPERRDELITIRRDMWQNSRYYTEISEALGFGG